MTAWLRILLEVIAGILASYFAGSTREKLRNANKTIAAHEEGVEIAARLCSDRDTLLNRMRSGK